MPFKTSFVSAAGAAAFALFASDVSAAVIFQDDFTRTAQIERTVGNGWNELERSSNDVSVLNNRLLLRDVLDGDGPDAAASSLVIDATGYENINVSFRWKSLRDNTISEDLFLSWALDPAPAMTDTDAWTHAFQGSAVGPGFHITNALLDGAEDSTFNVMLWSLVAGKDQGYLIDYVTVTGDEISPVPLPAGLPLLLGGLAALGLARRKRKLA